MVVVLKPGFLKKKLVKIIRKIVNAIRVIMEFS